jgi:hypothetical protein
MERSPSLEADRCSAGQEIISILWKLKIVTVVTVLSQTNKKTFFQIHFNIVFPLTCVSFFMFSYQMFACIFLAFCVLHGHYGITDCVASYAANEETNVFMGLLILKGHLLQETDQI